MDLDSSRDVYGHGFFHPTQQRPDLSNALRADETTERAVDELSHEFIFEHENDVLNIVEVLLADIYRKSIEDAYDRWNGELGTQLSPPGRLLERAVLFARDLRLRLSEAFRQLVRKLIGEKLEPVSDGREPTDSEIDRVRNEVMRDDFVEEVAEKLANENRTLAYEEGSYVAHQKLGATGKRWITRRDNRVDAICRENELAGIIDADARFPSGHLFSPAHLRCRCRVAYAGVTRGSLYWSTRDE